MSPGRGGEPGSAVPALDEWLAPFRERPGEIQLPSALPPAPKRGAELQILCRAMPAGAWKSVQGGSRKWLPEQWQDRGPPANQLANPRGQGPPATAPRILGLALAAVR
jgi:hypothetical protein